MNGPDERDREKQHREETRKCLIVLLVAVTLAPTGCSNNFHDGDDVVILASHAGRPAHPAWYYDLRANPAVTFGRVRMTAAEVLDEGERERLWILANRVFPAFERYGEDAAKAGRTILIIRLKPVE